MFKQPFSFWSLCQLSSSFPHHLLSQAACRHAPPPKPSPAQSAVTGPAFLQDSHNWQLWTHALFHPHKYVSRCEAPQLSLFLATSTQAAWMKAQPELQIIYSPPSSFHPSGECTEAKINLFTITEAARKDESCVSEYIIPLCLTLTGTSYQGWKWGKSMSPGASQHAVRNEYLGHVCYLDQ